MNYVKYPNTKILAYYAIIAPLIGSSLLILAILIDEYIFKPRYTTDVSIALMLTGAVYLFGSILSLPSHSNGHQFYTDFSTFFEAADYYLHQFSRLYQLWCYYFIHV